MFAASLPCFCASVREGRHTNMANNYACLPPKHVMERMIAGEDRASPSTLPAGHASGSSRKWYRPLSECLSTCSAVAALLQSTGLVAEVSELITAVTDLQVVCEQLQGMLASRTQLPDGHELQVLQFAKVRSRGAVSSRAFCSRV